MQTIGERLEEARKRKGISLREASEATKIRSDFLGNMERNQFDFELPEIYKRGFIKNYANYLQMDTETVLADYNARTEGHSGNRKRGTSELFGALDLKPTAENKAEPLLGTISTAPKEDDLDEPAPAGSNPVDKALYLKVAMIIAGVVVFLFVIIAMVFALLNNGSTSETATDTADTTSEAAAADTGSAADEAASEAAGQETASLIASGNVHVLVKQKSDGKVLVYETLDEGETIDFTKQGPVEIKFTKGEYLIIVNSDGKRVKPGGEGFGKISIP